MIPASQWTPRHLSFLIHSVTSVLIIVTMIMVMKIKVGHLCKILAMVHVFSTQ